MGVVSLAHLCFFFPVCFWEVFDGEVAIVVWGFGVFHPEVFFCDLLVG